LLTVANTRINGEYIFSGFRTNIKPFELDAAHPAATPAAIYNGDSNIKQILVSEDAEIATQIQADSFFLNSGASPTKVDLFQVLANLEQALLTNDIDDNSPTSVGQAL